VGAALRFLYFSELLTHKTTVEDEKIKKKKYQQSMQMKMTRREMKKERERKKKKPGCLDVPVFFQV
jgi:hypothetical protein